MEYSEGVTSLDNFLKREEEQFRELEGTLGGVSLEDEAAIGIDDQHEADENQEEFIRDHIELGYSDAYDRRSFELQDIYDIENENNGVHHEAISKVLAEEREEENKKSPITSLNEEEERAPPEMFYRSKSPPLITRTGMRSMNVDEDMYKEPEEIQEWKRRQQSRIEEKDAASAQKRAQVLEEGQKALEKFYEEYNYQKTKNMTLNKEREEASRRDREILPSSASTSWKRVCRYLDLNQKSNRSTKDLSRMKSLLLQLKNE
jgi:hypothetical protein